MSSQDRLPHCGEEIIAAMGGVKEGYRRSLLGSSCSKFTIARAERSIIVK